MWVWGAMFGAMNWEHPEDPPALQQVEGLTDILAVSVGGGGLLAVRADGTVWRWHADFGGMTPAEQVPGLTDAVAVAQGDESSYVVRAGGTVWSWGFNTFGQLCFKTTTFFHEGAQVPGLTGVVSLSVESSHVLAVRADGSAVSWGSNAYGVIGDGVLPMHTQPARVLQGGCFQPPSRRNRIQ